MKALLNAADRLESARRMVEAIRLAATGLDPVDGETIAELAIAACRRIEKADKILNRLYGRQAQKGNAGRCSMTAPDPFALGGRDPIIALGEELDRLDALAEALDDADDIDGSNAASARMNDVEDQIRVLVPTSITGIRRQLDLFARWAEDFQRGEEFQGAILANIRAGLRALEGGAARAAIPPPTGRDDTLAAARSRLRAIEMAIRGLKTAKAEAFALYLEQIERERAVKSRKT